MLGFSKAIGKNYAIDFIFLHKLRDFKDGITFLNFDMDLDLYEGDHNPQFDFLFCIFNYTLIEINLYNVNHVSSSSTSEVEAV